MRRGILKSAAFFACLALVLGAVAGVLRFKYFEGITNSELLRRQERGSVDVLFCGSSFAFENVDTAVIWDECGVAAFDYGGSDQPLWNSYFFIKEALDQQDVQLVVLDVLQAEKDGSDFDSFRAPQNILGLGSLIDRWEAIQASVPAELQSTYLEEFPLWHSRWEDVGAMDIMPDLNRANYWQSKGMLLNTSLGRFERPDLSAAEGQLAEIPAKSLEWLQKIIDLCRERGVELVFVAAPHPTMAVERQMIMNAVGQMAAEQGISFYNANGVTDEIGLDYATDFANDAVHLNWRGAQKYTRWLIDRLDLQSLPSHAGDPAYASWDVMARDTRERSADAEVQHTGTLGERLLLEAASPAWADTLFVVVAPDAITSEAGKTVRQQLLGCGIEVDSAGAMVVCAGERLWADTGAYQSGTWPDPIAVVQDGAVVTVSVGRDAYVVGEDELVVVAYNMFTRTLVFAESVSVYDGFEQGSSLW